MFVDRRISLLIPPSPSTFNLHVLFLCSCHADLCEHGISLGLPSMYELLWSWYRQRADVPRMWAHILSGMHFKDDQTVMPILLRVLHSPCAQLQLAWHCKWCSLDSRGNAGRCCKSHVNWIQKSDRKGGQVDHNWIMHIKECIACAYIYIGWFCHVSRETTMKECCRGYDN